MSDTILSGFHWTDGWFFQRNEDGSVRIAHLLRVNGEYQFPPVVNICIDADSWASIVASVSKGGEVDGRFYEAQAFHGSTGPNAERQRAERMAAEVERLNGLLRECRTFLDERALKAFIDAALSEGGGGRDGE